MLRPMILVLRRSNSGLRPAMYPSSVVHTGVKSFGCENRIAHLSPIQSWNRILPSVVSAVKSGASSPMRIAMLALHCLCGVGMLHHRATATLAHRIADRDPALNLRG